MMRRMGCIMARRAIPGLLAILLVQGCFSRTGKYAGDSSEDTDEVTDLVEELVPDTVDEVPVDVPEETPVDITPEVVDDTPADPVEDVPDDGCTGADAECASDGDCDDADPCTTDSCDACLCTNEPLDADEDGYVAIRAPTGEACGGTDCDDGRGDVYPGAPEVCLDGVDQDCDDIVDGPMTMGTDEQLSTATGLFTFKSRIAWSGSEYGVSWSDNRGGTFGIYFARVDASGSKIGTDDLISGPTMDRPSVKWTGSEYGLGWNMAGDVYFARLSPLGAKVGSDEQITTDPDSSSSPSLAWTGSEFGVGWYDTRDGDSEIYFARISAAGAKVGSDVRISNAAGDSYFPTLAWTGSEFGVAWYDQRDGRYEIYFARVSAAGTKVGPDVRVTNATGDSSFPDLAWSGSEFGAIWNDTRDANLEIYFARISAAGAMVGSDVRVTNATGDSDFPSIAWTGSEYGVVWVDGRDGTDRTYFVRLSPTGTKVGSDWPIMAHDSVMPSLVWNGSLFGVSWEDNRLGSYQIFFNRIGLCD